MATLQEVVGGVVVGDQGVVVAEVTHDSRQVLPGWLFVAVPGARFDGHSYVAEAVSRGASAVVVERQVDTGVPQLIVEDARRAMAPLAATVQGYPSSQVAVMGVTGTNGKTTVTHLVERIAIHAGRTCGLIGTIETRVGGQVIPNPHTTPEATDFQRLLRQMVDLGADLVACEVSSHALAMDRVNGTEFAVAAFTNLSQDHLDFHGSMESYFEAKASLFELAAAKVIWVGDPYGARLASRYPSAIRVGPEGDVRASRVAADPLGTSFELRLSGGVVSTRINLPGGFNLANALVAAGMAEVAGFTVAEIGEGLRQETLVPGRFEIVSGDGPFPVVVDYAHTPDGIASVIATARTLARGRVIAVVGAGGDRDRAKRPAMGKAASQADLVVVTSDNPRSEDPELIIDMVMAGVDNPAVLRVSDRREAIATAIGSAAPGDIVLLLGKGHERGQEIGGVVYPFDDREEARRVLAGLAE